MTPDDAKQAQDLNYRSSSKLRFFRFRLLWLSPIVSTAFLCLAIAAFLRTNDLIQNLAAVALGATSARMIWLRLNRTKRLKKQFALKHSGIEVAFNFDPELVRCTTRDSDTEMRWISFKGARSNNKVFLLYRTRVLFLVIPRRVMTPSEQDELDALFITHLRPGTYVKH